MSDLEPQAVENAHAQRGRLLLDMGRPREALAEWECARAREPGSAHVYTQISYCHYKLDEYEAALRFASDAIALDPGYGWAYQMRYFTLSQMGRGEEAAQAAEQCVTLEPSEYGALRCFALSLLERGRGDNAETVARRLVEMAPERARHWQVLAQTLLAQHQFAEAEQAARHALRLDPLCKWSFWYLADALWSQKRWREAYQTYDDALLLDPKDAFTQRRIVARAQERFWSNKAVIGYSVWRIGVSLLLWQLVYTAGGNAIAAFLTGAWLLFIGMGAGCQPYWHAVFWSRNAFREVPPAARVRWSQARFFRRPERAFRLLRKWFTIGSVLLLARSLAAIPTGLLRHGFWSGWGWAGGISILWFAVDALLMGYMEWKHKSSRSGS